jgi:hypothetical protein
LWAWVYFGVNFSKREKKGKNSEKKGESLTEGNNLKKGH